MLGLKLREEFLRQALEDTSVELTDKSATGATQVPASEFLATTYPSSNALAALAAIAPGKAGPVVLCGPRGQGKSHALGILHHALSDPETVQRWLAGWHQSCEVRDNVQVITDNLARKNYKSVWDLIFNWHVQGEWARGQWERLGDHGTQIPPFEVMVELFKKRPTALILDEYDSWFDALGDSDAPGLQTAALEFLYILAKVAQDHPDLLVLAIAVGDQNAQAIQDLEPVTIDFSPAAEGDDRHGLLLFRMFKNRAAIAEEEIRKSIEVHVTQYLRLHKHPDGEEESVWQSFLQAWPYSPDLLDVARRHIDHPGLFVRFLAVLFEQNHSERPLITPAVLRVGDAAGKLAGIFDSASSDDQPSLLSIARDNLAALLEATGTDKESTCAWEEIMSSLWLRSLSKAGATPAELQLDVTRGEVPEDDSFRAQLDVFTANCINVHEKDGRLLLEQTANPETRLLKEAACDENFSGGLDRFELMHQIKNVISSLDHVEKLFNIIVLPKAWLTDPWSRLEENERPAWWDGRITLLVVPETSDRLQSQLGEWLEAHVPQRRNTVRFLLPSDKKGNIFENRDLLFLVRASMLAAQWQDEDPVYKKMLHCYQRDLRTAVRKLFTRFAILDVWNEDDAGKSTFHIVRQKARGAQLPDAIDEYVRETLFDPDAFEGLLLTLARNASSISQLLDAVREPRPGQQHCIPWIGETALKEKVFEACANGKVDIDRVGAELIGARNAETEDGVWRKIRDQLAGDPRLGDARILLPGPAEADSPVDECKHEPDVEKTVEFEPAPEFAVTLGSGDVGLIVPEESAEHVDGLATDFPDGRDDVGSGAAQLEVPDLTCVEPVGGGWNFKLYHTSPLSLAEVLRHIETWEITDATVVERLMLKVSKLDGAQLKRLLRHLPEELEFEITLQKSDT